MVTLSQLLQHAFPLAKPLIDFEITDFGEGGRITFWNEAVLGAHPVWDGVLQTYPEFEVHLAAVEADILASTARKVWPSSADFWAAFTDTEKLAILASTIAGIILLREELRLWTGEVWSDDPRVQAGLAGLVAVGILTNNRKQAILTP